MFRTLIIRFYLSLLKHLSQYCDYYLSKTINLISENMFSVGHSIFPSEKFSIKPPDIISRRSSDFKILLSRTRARTTIKERIHDLITLLSDISSRALFSSFPRSLCVNLSNVRDCNFQKYFIKKINIYVYNTQAFRSLDARYNLARLHYSRSTYDWNLEEVCKKKKKNRGK